MIIFWHTPSSGGKTVTTPPAGGQPSSERTENMPQAVGFIAVQGQLDPVSFGFFSQANTGGGGASFAAFASLSETEDTPLTQPAEEKAQDFPQGYGFIATHDEVDFYHGGPIESWIYSDLNIHGDSALVPEVLAPEELSAQPTSEKAQGFPQMQAPLATYLG